MDIEPFLQYLRVERNFSDHTVKAYAVDLNQFQQFMADQFEVNTDAEIVHSHIRSWVVQLMENENHPNSIARKISAVKSYFKYQLRKGKLKHNPAFKVILPKKPKRLPKFIDQNSLNELLDNTYFPVDYNGQRDKLIIELFYYTGIREAELIGLKLEDVDHYNLQIKVLGKRNKQRLIPITLSFSEKLKEFANHSDRKSLPDNDFFFLTNGGKKLYPKFVYNIVNTYLSMVANATQKSPHILRHSFATHMLSNGADINAIKTILGHESLAATQVYTHNTIDKLKNIHKQAHPRG